jgi:acyl carrier protein
MDDEKLTRMRSLIAEMLGIEPDAVTDDAAFIRDLGADSLDVVELAMAMEETFGVAIPSGDYGKIVTVGDARAYLTASAR